MRPATDPPPMTEHAARKMEAWHADILAEVKAAIAANDVVVVGMKQNPHPRRVRNALTEAGVPFAYLEYGSYLSAWKERLAIKLWSGWPTFPQVFVKGTLVGGADQVAKMLEDGSLRAMLGTQAA